MSSIHILRKHKTVISVALLVIAIKIVLFLWAAQHFDFLTNPQNNWINIWDRWDGGVYKIIAQSSYNFINIKSDSWSFLSHFPPLYPLTMAIASRLLNVSLVHAGIIVSLVSILVASILLYKLTYLEFKSERVAWLSVIFLNLYPISYFTISTYSESLFLLLTIGSFYCLKREYYLGSGFAAAGAILTRFVGVVFLPVYALYFLYSYKKYGFNLKVLYPFLFSLGGLIIYLIINKFYFGHYFYFLSENASFNTTKHLIVPFKETFFYLLALLKNHNMWDKTLTTTGAWNAVFTLFAVIITTLGLRKINWIYSMYSLGSILLFASLSWGISNARYTLSVFPIFIILAHIKNKIFLSVILLISTLGLLYFTRIFTSGAWAF